MNEHGRLFAGVALIALFVISVAFSVGGLSRCTDSPPAVADAGVALEDQQCHESDISGECE